MHTFEIEKFFSSCPDTLRPYLVFLISTQVFQTVSAGDADTPTDNIPVQIDSVLFEPDIASVIFVQKILKNQWIDVEQIGDSVQVLARMIMLFEMVQTGDLNEAQLLQYLCGDPAYVAESSVDFGVTIENDALGGVIPSDAISFDTAANMIKIKHDGGVKTFAITLGKTEISVGPCMTFFMELVGASGEHACLTQVHMWPRKMLGSKKIPYNNDVLDFIMDRNTPLPVDFPFSLEELRDILTVNLRIRSLLNTNSGVDEIILNILHQDTVLNEGCARVSYTLQMDDDDFVYSPENPPVLLWSGKMQLGGTIVPMLTNNGYEFTTLSFDVPVGRVEQQVVTMDVSKNGSVVQRELERSAFVRKGFFHITVSYDKK